MSGNGTHRRDAGSRQPRLRRFRQRPPVTEALEPLPVRTTATRPGLPRGSSPLSMDVLERVSAGLRDLDAEPEPDDDIYLAFLRNIRPGARDIGEPLGGFPVFAGVTRLADGSPVAGLYLGDGDQDGRLVLDALSVGWLIRLIAAAEEARDGLYEQMARSGRDVGAA
jgi:hypothetical protein